MRILKFSLMLLFDIFVFIGNLFLFLVIDLPMALIKLFLICLNAIVIYWFLTLFFTIVFLVCWNMVWFQIDENNMGIVVFFKLFIAGFSTYIFCEILKHILKHYSGDPNSFLFESSLTEVNYYVKKYFKKRWEKSGARNS